MRRCLRRLATVWPIVPVVLLMIGSAASAQDGSAPEVAKETAQQSKTARPPEARVARLVKLLGSDSYAQREEADDALAKIGQPSRPQLEAALDAEDAEIRLRARRLIERLKVSELWLPASVTLSVPNMKVSQALDEIAQQTGNHVLVGEAFGSLHDRSLTLDTTPTTFWKAIDDICRQSDNHIRPHYDPRPGVVMISGATGMHPVAYSGPVRAHITKARRVFSEQFDYATRTSDIDHTFQIDLKLLWEDRFHLVAYRSQPILVEAVTDTGVRLVSVKRSGGGREWNEIRSGLPQLTASMALRPPALSAKELDRFVLKWEMIAVGDMTQLEVTNLESKEPHHGDDLELVVEEVRKERRGSHYVVTVLVSRDLVLPEPREVLLNENRIELFDNKGREFHHQGTKSILADRGVKVMTSFRVPQLGAEPHRLRITYPRIRDQRELEIVFRHVPLPMAKPEP